MDIEKEEPVKKQVEVILKEGVVYANEHVRSVATNR